MCELLLLLIQFVLDFKYLLFVLSYSLKEYIMYIHIFQYVWQNIIIDVCFTADRMIALMKKATNVLVGLCKNIGHRIHFDNGYADNLKYS